MPLVVPEVGDGPPLGDTARLNEWDMVLHCFQNTATFMIKQTNQQWTWQLLQSNDEQMCANLLKAVGAVSKTLECADVACHSLNNRVTFIYSWMFLSWCFLLFVITLYLVWSHFVASFLPVWYFVSKCFYCEALKHATLLFWHIAFVGMISWYSRRIVNFSPLHLLFMCWEKSFHWVSCNSHDYLLHQLLGVAGGTFGIQRVALVTCLPIDTKRLLQKPDGEHLQALMLNVWLGVVLYFFRGKRRWSLIAVQVRQTTGRTG